jgi:DNA modification methylase
VAAHGLLVTLRRPYLFIHGNEHRKLLVCVASNKLFQITAEPPSRGSRSRTPYWYQHEPCWFVRKKNVPWFGKPGENTTVWDSPSPKFVRGGSGEDKFDHPNQKPAQLTRKPILNHTRQGELVYDPFLGSGTTLAVAELTERVCSGMELDPKYVDVVVKRWEKLTGKQAVLEGDGRTLDEISAERKPAIEEA